MTKNRMEAFSDGVIAIIITLMAFEMKPPQGASFAALRPLLPVFASYALSFVYVGIYWNNHHHMLHAVERVNGRVLLANLHLLFWLSLFPFVTDWGGRNSFAEAPTALYGAVLLMAAVAYYILSRALIRSQGHETALAAAVGRDAKGLVSILIYTLAIALAFVAHRLSFALYVLVAVLWFVPDRRIEKAIGA